MDIGQMFPMLKAEADALGSDFEREVLLHPEQYPSLAEEQRKRLVWRAEHPPSSPRQAWVRKHPWLPRWYLRRLNATGRSVVCCGMMWWLEPRWYERTPRCNRDVGGCGRALR